eukprot:gene29988-36222_t
MRSLRLLVLIVLWILWVNLCHGEEAGASSSQWKDNLFNYLQWPSLYGPAQSCRYRTDLSNHVNQSLTSHISGQDESLDSIVSAISVWEMQKKMDHREPLVLAITGPTGVGKTETAYRLAEGLFADKRTIVNEFGAQTQVPCGLLVLRGEDYSPSSELAALGVHEVHRVLKSRIINHLVENNGNAMVLFDEVQKLLPGVLELFMPALEEHGTISSTTYIPTPTSPPTVTSYTQYTARVLSNLLPAYITNPAVAPTGSPDDDWDAEEYMDEEEGDDIDNRGGRKREYVGMDRIIRHLILLDDDGEEGGRKRGKSRGGISLDSINNEVKQVMDETFERLKLGKVINTIIPYLPMEKAQVEGVLQLHLRKYQAQFKYHQWLCMYVDPNVYGYMSSPPFVTYKNHSLQFKVYSKDSGEGKALEVTGGTQNAQIMTKSKRFATYGARGIKTGPLSRLQALISKYMQPHQADKVLHIGLLTQHNVHRSQELWGNENMQDFQIYLQWCTPNAAMVSSSFAHLLPEVPTPPPRGKERSADYQSLLNRYNRALRDILSMYVDSVTISDDVAFSNLCDTKWFGKIT